MPTSFVGPVLTPSVWPAHDTESFETDKGTGFDGVPGADHLSATASVHGPAPRIDRGDHYFVSGRPVPLWRATDQIVVELRASAADVSLLAGLTGPTGPLPGFRVDAALGESTFSLVSPSGALDDLDATLAALAARPDVSWAAPVFINGESESRQWVTDEVVVALPDGVDPARMFGGAGYTRLLGTPDQYVVTLTGRGGLAALEQANRWDQDPRVRWASPNFFQEGRTQTNDPLFANQWHLNNTGQFGARPDADADVQEAWSTTVGSSDVVIAVIDDGVQTSHPDLNIFVNAGEIAGNGVDDDGNGWVDDRTGLDFSYTTTGQYDADPNHDVSFERHGTSVAGVAAAAGDNALGVTGASQRARVLPIKPFDVANAQGQFAPFSSANVASAIYYAAGRTASGVGTWRGADILNNSWGGGASNSVINAAFDWAVANGRGGRGTPNFVAAGNGASDYRGFTLSGFPAGTFQAEWRYIKNGSGNAGADTAWLGQVRFPNGTVERFDAATLPAGWTSTGSATWDVVDDPGHSYGTGRYAAKAGTIAHSQQSNLRSPVFAGGGNLVFRYWVSSELSADVLQLWISSNGGAFTQQNFSRSGVVATATTPSWPASLASSIAVGASTDWDYRSDYSQYGGNLDFVAPSSGGFAGITTTDRTGADGYDAASDYTSAFGGTSSATPLAAGVAALMLARNPNLTAAQVRQYLRDTADKVGNVTYTAGFNQYYGYGRINAAAAVAAAVPAPEAAVEFNGVAIADGDDTPSAADGTDFGSVLLGGAPVSRAFTVRNLGTATLTLGSIFIPAGFSLTEALATSLAPGASDTFTLRLDTWTSGTKSGEVRFATNDGDESPYNFAVAGTVTMPEAAVEFNGVAIADGDDTPSAADGTDFGSVLLGGAPVSRIFTVRNDGTATLTLGSIFIPAGFSLTEALATSLAPGASDTFTLRLDTWTSGTKSGEVRFATNDGDESPYNFSVAGAVTVPEATIEGNGLTVADGDDTPGPPDGTDFGSVLLGGTTISRTFTVRNLGTATLTLGSIYIPVGFSLTEGLAASLAPGASDTFTLRLDADMTGTKSGEVRFATNDADENPYNFSVAGTVTTVPSPEATADGNGVTIADGDGTPSTADDTDFGGVALGGAPVSRTFTVRNMGTATLTLGTIYIPAGFSLTEALATTLAPGASDTFTLRLDTWTLGAKGGEVRFATDDADESPYNFAVAGAVTAPEAAVEGNGVPIADGDDSPSAADGTDFGSVLLGGAPISRTFTVRNDGTATLTLGTIYIPAGFSLTEGLVSSLAPGASDTFTLRLDTWTLGAKGGEVRFATNDGDESPYNFTVAGAVTAPEAAVEFDGAAIADGDDTPSAADGTDFGSVALGGAPVSRTFTVRNLGTATLALGSIHIPAGFSLTEALSTTLAPGAFDTFTLRLDTWTVGTKSGEVRFATDDSDENPYNFTVTGVVS